MDSQYSRVTPHRPASNRAKAPYRGEIQPGWHAIAHAQRERAQKGKGGRGGAWLVLCLLRFEPMNGSSATSLCNKTKQRGALARSMCWKEDERVECSEFRVFSSDPPYIIPGNLQRNSAHMSFSLRSYKISVKVASVRTFHVCVYIYVIPDCRQKDTLV